MRTSSDVGMAGLRDIDELGADDGDSASDDQAAAAVAGKGV